MTAESASSVYVSRTLDDLGYNQQMVRLRQLFFEKVTLQLEDGYFITAGSKGEGLTKVLESDFDYLYACNRILCTSRNPVSYNNVENLTVLHMDRTNVVPGYTRLIHVKTGTFPFLALDAALTEPIAGNIYLSSDSWREHMRQFQFNNRDLTEERLLPAQGPSVPVFFLKLGGYSDNVTAIMCDCPEILQSWIQRPRRNGWPPAEVIEEISYLEAHAVPVGFKGSQCQFLEWRICFTRAEIKLIKSLNDAQVKLVILLKMIAKNSLKPVCTEMTSYVMKNVVLWLAELYPPEYFTEQNLLLSLQRALRFLRQCLVGRFLPSYMIPERNLLVNILAHANGPGLSEITGLCTTVDTLLLEGPRVVLRCDKIRNALNQFYTAPETFRFFINTSRQSEIMCLLFLMCWISDEPRAKEKLGCLQTAFAITTLPLCLDLLHLEEEEQKEFFHNQIKLILS